MQQPAVASSCGASTGEFRSRSLPAAEVPVEFPGGPTTKLRFAASGLRGARIPPGPDGDGRSRNRHSESESRGARIRPPWGTYGAPWVVTAVTCPVHGFSVAR